MPQTILRVERIDEVSIESHGTNYCYTGESTATDYVFVYDAKRQPHGTVTVTLDKEYQIPMTNSIRYPCQGRRNNDGHARRGNRSERAEDPENRLHAQAEDA